MSVIVHGANIPQVENTLYRLSVYALTQGSNFFATIFSMDPGENPEGQSDDNPVVLPATVTRAEFDVYLWHGIRSVLVFVRDVVLIYDAHIYRYDQNPTQDDLINAISISRQWSIHSLYGYAIDHFRRQFLVERIHPAVVLGVSRRFGIPDMIESAVLRLARFDLPFSSWATDPNIIRHISVAEMGTIGRMREKLLLVRFVLCAVPPVSHDDACPAKIWVACSAAWREFWMAVIIPKLCSINSDINNELWWIRSTWVAKAKVEGMTHMCKENTVEEVVSNVGWSAETRISDGAVKALMVPEQDMLEPSIERMAVDS